MNQKLGQHFLRDAAALNKIAREAAPEHDETIIEIGGGHGELTACLLRVAPGANIVTIERDPELAAHLRKHFESYKNLAVIEGDVRTLLPQLVKSIGKKQSYRLAGNIPYYLTGYLFRIIGELPRLPAKIVLTIQKEVAERIVAEPPHMNRLAASIQYWAVPKIIGTIARDKFSPPPQVDAAILALTPRDTAPETAKERGFYFSFIRALFAQPRKTIENNLFAIGRGSGLTRSKIKILIEKTSVPSGGRPQDLSIDKINDLEKSFRKILR